MDPLNQIAWKQLFVLNFCIEIRTESTFSYFLVIGIRPVLYLFNSAKVLLYIVAVAVCAASFDGSAVF